MKLMIGINMNVNQIFQSQAQKLGSEITNLSSFLNDLKQNEIKEIKVISNFLPKQLSEEETKKLCQEAIKSSGATSMKDMGKVMGILKSKHADTLDFSKVSSVIKEILN